MAAFVDSGVRRNDDLFSSADMVKYGSSSGRRSPRTALRLRRNDDVVACDPPAREEASCRFMCRKSREAQ
jgi:hypothetical protein